MLSDIPPDYYQKIKTVLEGALSLPAAEQSDFVEKACAGDAHLLADVWSLLAHYAPEDEFLENFSVVSALNDVAADSADKFIGQKISHYRLMSELGRGGMGVVFLATREDFHQQVAVKLIKRGMDSDAIIERFTREREILAALNHPYIARLTDGGTTPDSVPFFVMEYVEGLPVDEFCEQNKLSEKELLALFRRICEAVSFAHRKLVIHRDLKPTNILVTADGTPKLLDFGIAKLLTATGGRETQLNMRPLTPFYASPEQISGAPVDTTSDVYSLGVILYELLTGARPAENKHSDGAAKAERTSQPQAIKKPSEALRSELSNPEASGGKKTTLTPKALKGDLDNIVLKALNPQPAQRYASVEQFSEDIRRHLEGLPVSARRPTIAYQGIKFINRHRLSFTAGMLLLLTLVGGIITTTLQRIRAENDERENHRLLYAARMSLAYQAWNSANTGRAIDLLETQKAESSAQELQSFEWRLLWRLTHDGARVLREPTNKVRSVAFSPDGAKIAGGSLDGKIHLWNAKTGELLNTFDSETDGNLSLAFSPNGKYLAVGTESDSTLLWEAETGKLVRKFTGRAGDKSPVAFSPDGQTLAAADNNLIKLWNLETGALLATLDRHTDSVTSISFSPDGKTLATGSNDHTVKLWDAASGQELATLKGHTWWVLTVAYSPDGQTLASSGSDGQIKLWNVAARREQRTIPGDGSTITSVNFSPDGKTLCAGGDNGTIKLYATESGSLKDELRGHTDNVYAVAFSPDGQTLASGGADHTVRLWNLNRHPGTATLEGHQDWVWDSAFSPDGQTLATASKDATVKLWNTADGSERTKLIHPQWVNGVAFSPDGTKLATASDDTFVRLWNPETGQLLSTLNENDTIAECVAFSPDGKILAAGSKKGDIKLWETATGKEIATFRSPYHNLIWSLAFSPDGKYLVSAEGGLDALNIASGHLAEVWNVATGQIAATLDDDTSDVRAVAFAPDGKTLVTGSYDRTIKFWDVPKFREIAALQSDQVESLAFSADGTRLLSGNLTKTVKIWDPATKQELATLTVPGIVQTVAISPDNNILAAAGSDNKIRLWYAGSPDRENSALLK